jgi:lipoprotein-anchoring transpeptidase ErfK/SrfK
LRLSYLAFLGLAAALAGGGQAYGQSIGVIVDRGDRTATVYRDGDPIFSEPVAVGKPGHATPTGSWKFTQVDINPDWTPPDSEWSKDASYTPPGHPDNPMGRVRMIFNRPYTIHGTDAYHSLGRAASHGSIRMGNERAIELAALLLKEGGAWQGGGWFQRMLSDPTRMHEIPLPKAVPIDVVP